MLALDVKSGPIAKVGAPMNIADDRNAGVSTAGGYWFYGCVLHVYRVLALLFRETVAEDRRRKVVYTPEYLKKNRENCDFRGCEVGQTDCGMHSCFVSKACAPLSPNRQVDVLFHVGVVVAKR